MGNMARLSAGPKATAYSANLYFSFPLGGQVCRVVCLFSDASTKAISAVAYPRAVDSDGNSNVGFVLDKAKLAPQHKPTIPRLELYAAVMVVEIADLIRHEIDLRLDVIRFYCESQVVLGYIYNETKCFMCICTTEQWFYVPTELNPADHASRGVAASQLNDSAWLKGPLFLSKPYTFLQVEQGSYEVVCPKHDTEIRHDILSYCTQIGLNGLETERFKRFSTWKNLERAIALLVHIAQMIKSKNGCGEHVGWHQCSKPRTHKNIH